MYSESKLFSAYFKISSLTGVLPVPISTSFGIGGPCKIRLSSILIRSRIIKLVVIVMIFVFNSKIVQEFVVTRDERKFVALSTVSRNGVEYVNKFSREDFYIKRKREGEEPGKTWKIITRGIIILDIFNVIYIL